MLYARPFILSILFLLASCASNKSLLTGVGQYQEALSKYAAKNYDESLRLLDESLPQLRGKKEEASAHFYGAYCLLHKKEFILSSERFKYFYKTFLRDSKREEAIYMRAYALYRASPHVEFDQTITHDAVRIFDHYIHCYPDGSYTSRAEEQLKKLNNKLALKDFAAAKLYYQLAYYKAAVAALINFQKEFPSSSYGEESAYLKANAQYQLLKEVSKTEKEEQLKVAIKYCQEFLDHYPDSSRASVISEIYASLYTAHKPMVTSPEN